MDIEDIEDFEESLEKIEKELIEGQTKIIIEDEIFDTRGVYIIDNSSIDEKFSMTERVIK